MTLEFPFSLFFGPNAIWWAVWSTEFLIMQFFCYFLTSWIAKYNLQLCYIATYFSQLHLLPYTNRDAGLAHRSLN
jgi:hypothetical protein